MSAWTYVNIKGQRHSLTLVQGHSDSTFANFFSLETTRPVEAKFHVKPPWDGETKDCSNGQGHMTNMASMPIYGKNLKKSSSLEPKNLLLWNQKTNDLETWYAALGTWVLPSLFNWWLWVYLDLFYGKDKFVPLCFLWEKVKGFSETIVVYDIKVGRYNQLNEYMKLYEYQRSRSLTLVQIS